MKKGFRDRRHAGRVLAGKLEGYGGMEDVLVLALPRGGVPVAYEIADSLDAPLDVFVVRKLGVPWHEELALGAIATGGVRVLNDEVVDAAGLSTEEIERVAAREEAELKRREASYRGERPPVSATDRTVILVDDGLATGSTMRAAIAAVRTLNPARIIVAVPVAAASVCEGLGHEVDEIVCPFTPEPMAAISLWYDDFAQTGDDEVRALLGSSRRRSVGAERG